jgi:hypothetical protein
MEEFQSTEPNPSSQRESVYDKQNKSHFFIKKQFWYEFVWPVGLTHLILSYRYTIPIFDLLYLIALVYYLIYYREVIYDISIGNLWFIFYGTITSLIMILLPPLSIRLLKDIFLNSFIPSLFILSKKYDPYYHLRVSCYTYVNLLGCALMILFSTILNYNPFSSKEIVPWLLVSVIPSGLALSILIAVMEGVRIIQLQYIHSLQLPDGHISIRKYLLGDEKNSECEAQCLLSSLAVPSLPPSWVVAGEGTSLTTEGGTSPSTEPNRQMFSSSNIIAVTEEFKSHFIQLRSEYLILYQTSQSVSQRYGLVILLYVLALAMYSAYLIWYLYLVDDITISDIVPYLTICVGGLIELTFSLTLVNEIGESIKREVARHVLLFTHEMSVKGMEDASLLLACSNKLTIDIPFRGGFSLRSRHTMVLLGPLIATVIPTIVEKSKHG